MSHFPTLHILILVIANLQIQCFAFVSQSRGFCATGPPTESLKAEYRRLSALGSQSYNPVDSESRAAITPIVIDTWFHIITGEAGTELISDEMIADQVSGDILHSQ